MALHLVTGYEGAEHIQSQDQGSFNIAAFGEGQYVLDHGYKFEAALLAGNTVRIKDGDMLMQGHHIRLAAATSEEINIDNGTAGMMRNDLIVARYTKNNSTGTEAIQFVVIKGTETASSPVDPEYNTGIITDGNDLINDFPLYRVSLNGTDITISDPLFEVKRRSGDSEFILCNKQVLTFTNNVCTMLDSRITADSLADVYFTSNCAEIAQKASIDVETSSGALTLTAGRTPEGTLTATIKVRAI